MKKVLWQVLPIVIGLTFGFFLFNPPNAFRALGWPGWLILPGCFILLIFIFLPGLLFVNQAFKDARMIPVERDLRKKDVRILAEQFWKLGFKPAGPALKIVGIPAVILGFIREDIAVVGAILRIEAGFGKTTFAFSSSLGDAPWGLTSERHISAATEPHSPENFHQVFPGRNMEELLLEHLRGLEWLHSRGIMTKAINPETFGEDALRDLQKHRQFLRQNWFRNMLIFVWRLASKINPHRGPVERQKIAAEYVRQIAREPVVTAESQARQNMIRNLEQMLATPADLKHSGYGIASFVISLVSGMTVFALFFFSVVLGFINKGGPEQGSPITGVMGCVLILAGLGFLIGLALGISGAAERRRKKIFTVLGIVFNALGISAVAGLIAIGMLFGEKI